MPSEAEWDKWLERKRRTAMHPKGITFRETHPNSKPDPRWVTVYSPEIAAFNRRMRRAGWILLALLALAVAAKIL